MEFRSGAVALMGRPNAGKSTLLNRLLGEKLAIVSDKPQTTRHRLVGILTLDHAQVVFYDTPGMHKPLHRLNRQMVRHAHEALREADVVCLLVDASQRFGRGDEHLLEVLAKVDRPRIVALNKVDAVAKPKILPLIERYSASELFREIVPISALDGDGCDVLLRLLIEQLPVGPPRFDSDLFTVHPERFLAAELIREALLRATRDELPFTTAVDVERWDEVEDRELTRIHALILVEKPSQKGIVVGKGGARIKRLGIEARQALEAMLGRRVYLDLHVRCEPDWREDRGRLAELDRFASIPASDA